MKDLTPPLAPLVPPRTTALNLVLGYGISRWRHADSDLRRLVYAYSHPIIILCLMTYGACFSPYLNEINHFAPVATVISWVDNRSGIPSTFSAKSAFPDITRMFFGLWIFQMPIMTTILAPRLWLAERDRWEKHWGTKSLRWQFGMILALPAILLVMILGVLIPGDPSFCNGCTTHSKAGLFVIYGLGVPGLLAFLVAGIPSLILYFIKSLKQANHIRSRNKWPH